MDSESFFKGFWTAVKLGRHFVMGLISKFITRNGTYIAANDGADGYSTVTVDVTPEFTVADEGKVVENGALVSQTSLAVTQNGTYNTTANNEVVVNVSGGGSTILSGAEDPASSDGSNGDIYLKTATLPDGVTPVEWIATDAQQWIQTGYAPQRDDVELDIDVNVDTANAGNAALISRDNQRFWLITHIGGSPNLTAAWGGVDVRSNQYNITGRRVHIRYTKGHVYVTETDGTVICDWYPNSGASYNDKQLTLFGYQPNDSLIRATFYRLKVYEGSNLVREYVPILDSNGVACLYELITQQYFYNQGSGAFTAGSVSTEPVGGLILAAFAKVNGVWQPLIGTNISDVTH